MSISPVSDIVLDVLRAADPAKSKAAAAKLFGDDASTLAATASFDHLLTSSAPLRASPDSRANIGGQVSAAVPHTAAWKHAYKGLEQLVLKSLVENMLPNESSGLFGAGTAGNVWRFLLADELAAGMGNTVTLWSGQDRSSTCSSNARTPQTCQHLGAATTAYASLIKKW